MFESPWLGFATPADAEHAPPSGRVKQCILKSGFCSSREEKCNSYCLVFQCIQARNDQAGTSAKRLPVALGEEKTMQRESMRRDFYIYLLGDEAV